jgi:uncharacterized phiE125 gp8 family phage protein
MSHELILDSTPVSGGGSIVTLAELKSQSRYEGTDEDTLILRIGTSATTWCENWTRRQFVTANWIGHLRAFPAGRRPIVVPRPPLAVINEVAYTDTNGDPQVLATTEWESDLATEPGLVVLKPSKDWPDTELEKHHGVTVDFDAGYGAVAAVPEPIRHAALMLAAFWFDNREGVTVGAIGKELEFAVQSLLQPYVVPQIG